jgi:fructose-1,6-bisphosphatase II
MGGEHAGPAVAAQRRGAPASIDGRLRPGKVLTQDDLVSGDNCFFAATGMTDGELLDGVRYQPDRAVTQSLVMRSRSGTVRLIEAHHRIDKLSQFSSVTY